jgi:hypothetical protein
LLVVVVLELVPQPAAISKEAIVKSIAMTERLRLKGPSQKV